MLEGTFQITDFLLQSKFVHSNECKIFIYDAKLNQVSSVFDVLHSASSFVKKCHMMFVSVDFLDGTTIMFS